MNDNFLTTDEINKTKILYDRFPTVNGVYLKSKASTELYFSVQKRMKPFSKTGLTPPQELKSEFSNAKEICEDNLLSYQIAMNNWNEAMFFICRKFKYKKLSEFLNLNEMGGLMNKNLACGTQLIAEAKEVQVLHILSPGDYSLNLVNIYPEKWLYSHFKITQI